MKPNVKKPSKEEAQEAESWPTWEKEESTFPWEYGDQETCLILDGKAVVKCPDGSAVEFGAGDYVVFPVGLKCTWEIKDKIRKHYKFG
ncbi:MAG: cupin domain-containing protein [Candidatus Bathyarchaeota archaeon]|nr:cupin domain-containing protein [Candidatus Bathyarchaeota archaeon]